MDSAAELARARADVARRGAELDSLEASAPERPLAEARLKVARAAFEVADAAHERELATDAVVAAAALLDSAEIAVQLAAAAAAASEQSGDGEAADNARTAAAQKERAREERRIKLAERRRERAERQRALEERQRALEERQRALEQRELRERQLRDLGTPSSPPPAPRVLIPSPSQRARSQIQHKLLKRWMPTAQNVAAMVELHSPRDRDDAAVQEWQRLFKWIEKGPPAGAFSRTEFFTSQSDEHRKLEVAMVSQLALYLEKRLRDRRRDSITDSSILWINELSTAKSNRVDLALLSVEDSGVANIRVIVDSVVGSSSMNKEAPIDAYVYEVTSTSLADHRPYHLLGIALGLPQNGSMEASVWAFSGFNDKRQQDQNRSLLFSGSGNCSAGELMARLEAAACAFAETEPEDALAPFYDEPHLFWTADRKLRKVVFDPERSEQWRDVTEAAEVIYKRRGGFVRRLRDCRRPLYIEYPFNEGYHLPGTAADAVRAAQAVMNLHSAGFIHGDIRLSNILFSGDGAAHLIDFDLAGTVSSTYVSNYNTQVVDGVRAAGANSGQQMEYVHDWEALAGTFSKCLQPPEGHQSSDWETALELLRSGNFSGLQALGAFPLEPTDVARALFVAPAAGARGTASPASPGSRDMGEPPAKRPRTES